MLRKPWPATPGAARNYGPRFYYYQKLMWTNSQRDRERDIETGGHTSLTGPHWVPPEISVGIK